MTYVVTDNCIRCKYTDCVEVCPVDCFYEGENMLVINPDECIDCGVCEPECPAEAIKVESEEDTSDAMRRPDDPRPDEAQERAETILIEIIEDELTLEEETPGLPPHEAAVAAAAASLDVSGEGDVTAIGSDETHADRSTRITNQKTTRKVT